MTENKLKNNDPRQTRSDVLRSLRKKLIMRAVFIITTVLLTAVLLFSLTVAWYTNVLGAGGLNFVAKKWDFNGKVVVGDGAITMAPGDYGLVPLQITNNGEETAIAGVSVSKKNFDADMQQRVFFYVNAPTYRNGERMEKVYVSANSGYSYTVFPNSKILITETSQNAPALMWEWVYDTLGYYVLGSLSADGFSAVEYIRPIEYDYDPIKTTFNADGTLKTIDGVTTVDEYITELSKTDGYEGEINVSARKSNYYPVYVNEEGYGVWAYFCTDSEIKENSIKDTQLGAEQKICVAEIIVTGVNGKDDAVEVANAQMFETLLTTSTAPNIKLTGDVTLENQIVLKEGTQATINLNGYTLTSTQATTLIDAGEGSKITITDGSFVGNNATNGIVASGAEVVMSNVKLSGVREGIRVNDNTSTNETDSRIHIVNSDIIAEEDALWVFGNGGTETKTTVIVENSTLEGTNYMGIICNGANGGTNIQILRSSVKGKWTAIYHPQNDSTLTVVESKLEGYTGLAIKGGTVNIENSEIYGTGAKAEPAYALNGYTDTGDGVYLEANYEGVVEINISGEKTKISSAYNEAVRKYMDDVSTAKISISAGEFSTSVDKYLADGAVQTEDGETYTYKVTTTP